MTDVPVAELACREPAEPVRPGRMDLEVPNGSGGVGDPTYRALQVVLAGVAVAGLACREPVEPAEPGRIGLSMPNGWAGSATPATALLKLKWPMTL